MLDRYIKLLIMGEAVAFPTETVYGLGACARKFEAVRKIFEIKQRPADNPLIVHISSRKMLQQFAAEIPGPAEPLMNAFWPGPLTLIFKKKADVLDIVTAGLDTVAVRWPNHPVALDLIDRAGPLAAPSANSSGKPSPTRAAHVKEDFGEDFPVVEGGETDIGLESTVLDISQTTFRLFRPGVISRRQIEEVIGKPVEMYVETAKNKTPKSPGIKYTHYAPSAKVQWWHSKQSLNSPDTLYLLHSLEPDKRSQNIICFNGNYQNMAHQLFDRFRQADRENYTFVSIESFSAELLSKEPLAAALQNRISKAAG